MLDKVKKLALGVAALSGAAIGGAAVAGAATSGTTTVATPSGQPPPALRNMPAPGTAAHEDHEQAVTGDSADKARRPRSRLSAEVRPATSLPTTSATATR